MADKVIDVEIRTNTTGIKSLRQELRETTIALQQATDPKYIDELQQKAGELKDRMMDVNAEINAMASGSKFEKVSASLGLVGQSLSNLDFAEASERAALFAKTAKTITFKDAISSVKSLGSTFMQLGQSLLKNPLFLLVAVIVLIAVAIYKLMEKLGLIKKIFEAVGYAIDLVVQAIKDFLDWIGLTGFAAEDAAQKQADAAEKVAKSQEEKTKSVIDGLDNEIRMNKLLGKDTEALERKKVWLIEYTAKKRYEADMAAAQAAALKGDMDQKEIAALYEKARASGQAVKNAHADAVYFEKETAVNKVNERAKDQKNIDENNKKAAEKRKQNQEKINQEIEKAKEFNKAAQKENELNLLSAQEREIKISNDKYQEQINQAIKYKQDYSQIVIAQKNAENEINLKFEEEKKKATEAAQAAIDQINKEFATARLSDIEQEKLAVNDKYTAAIEAAKKAGLDTTILLLNQQAEIDAIDLDYLEKKKTNQVEFASWMAQFELDERAAFLASLDAKQLEEEAKLKEFRDKKLISEQEYQDKLKGIESKKAQDVAVFDKQVETDKNNAKIKLAGEAINVIADLGTMFLGKSEADAKKAFKINKAASMAQAIISTYLGANAIFASAAANPKTVLFPAQPFIAAGIAIASGFANVAKIAQTQYGSTGGGGGGAKTPNIPSPSVSEPQANATPSFNLFGSGGTANNQNASGNNTNGNNITVTAVVSETDMTYNQGRVNSMKLSAAL